MPRAPAHQGSANASTEPAWSDVLFVEEKEPTVSYRTGWVVYEESFIDGQLVGRGWNGAGFISFYDGRLDPSEYQQPEAFRLEIDGQSLSSDWKWGGFEKLSSDGPNTHVIITLIHTLRPVYRQSSHPTGWNSHPDPMVGSNEHIQSRVCAGRGLALERCSQKERSLAVKPRRRPCSALFHRLF